MSRQSAKASILRTVIPIPLKFKSAIIGTNGDRIKSLEAVAGNNTNISYDTENETFIIKSINKNSLKVACQKIMEVYNVIKNTKTKDEKIKEIVQIHPEIIAANLTRQMKKRNILLKRMLKRV